MKKHHRTFVAATNAADLDAQLRLARGPACRLILYGIDGTIGALSEAIDELAGGTYKPKLPNREASDDWADYCLHLDAAFALGVVIGQLVHPDVFKTGVK